MRTTKKALIALASILATALATTLLVAPAEAEIYKLDVSISERGAAGPEPRVVLDIAGVDPAKSTNLRVRRPGFDAPFGVLDIPAGSASIHTDQLTELRPGDSIEVRQPLNGVDPVKVLAVPNGSIEIEGSRVSGTAGTGELRQLEVLPTCNEARERRIIPESGGYSFDFGRAASPGREYLLTVRQKPGFRLTYLNRAQGERPCLTVDSTNDPNRIPGSVVPETWNVSVSGLDPVQKSTRMVIRRGGAPILDVNMSTSGYGRTKTDQRIVPGDQIEIYRPQTAMTPASTVTVPPVRATFDPAADLAAVSGAALREAQITACKPRACLPSTRGLLDIPAGGATVDFKEPQGISPRLDLEAGDLVRAYVKFSDVPLRYAFDATPGDLLAPVQRIKARKAYRIRGLLKLLARGFPARVSTSEPSSGEIRLLKGRVTLAQSKIKLDQVVSTRLRFTAKGKNVLRRWLKGRSLRRPGTLTLESRLTDLSGNSSVSSRKVQVKP